MSKGENLLIHTDSAYAPGLSVYVGQGNYSLDDLYRDAYDNLRTAEVAFYHQFYSDVNTIDAFIERLRKLFEDAQQDAEYLKRFTNANLSKFLPNNPTFYFEQGYNIEMTGDVEKIALDFKGPSGYMKGDLYLAINPENAQLIKHILNVGLKRRGNNQFQDNDNITRDLVTILRDRKAEGLFTIVASTSPQDKKDSNFDITNVSKTEYNKENIDRMLKDTSAAGKERLSQLRMEARKSFYAMKNFLFSQISGASKEMQEAVEETWRQLFPSMGDDILLRNFFFEGENYAKALLGQGGEFYNNVLIKYIGKKTQHPILAEIIGSELKGGQQPHSDLQIMIEVGADIGTPNFQTKNVNGKQNIKISTNAALIQNNFGDNVISALVNYYANTDYKTAHGDIIEDVKELLHERFFQAMNLNIAPQLDNMQTNTFYFVGGDKIIPGSEIIQDIMNLSAIERPHFEISGSRVSPSLSNEEYEEHFTDYFYWKYPKGYNSGPENMIATPKNPPAFAKAAASIAIKTSFNISTLINSGRFEIFY